MMEPKNDCQVDYIKEAFDKLYNSVMPYIDLTQFADARTAFQELDKKVHSEIYILKKCLDERDRTVKALNKENIDLESENNAKQHVIESFTIKVKDLEKELAQARNSTELLLRKENDRLRIVIDGLEKENASLTEDADALVAENADLHARLSDDAIRIKSLYRANSVLRSNNGILWSKMEECDLDIFKRPWHGDGNAMTDDQASYKSLVEAIEFQGKKIEELEAEKARLKEAYDIHETTIKKENVDLSYGHEFEFGDEVFVPWSDEPYMYVKPGMMYNPRTERLVYVGKDQHLKWFGEKFSIV